MSYLGMQMEYEKDNINPDHYKSDNGLQCIDFIKASMTKEAFAGYCKGNILKYIFRYEQKNKTNKTEDLHKAQWYLKELITLYET
jgi:hypothetical protein